MATKRRGGLRPPELRGTLGSLLRTTTGVVRDALERGAREGRALVDDARANRRRHDTLADLGELVLDLIRRGEIDLAELPEARDLIRQLDDLDADTDEPDPATRPPLRRRFDERRRDSTPTLDDRPRRNAPPTVDDRPRRAPPATPATDDDGTVSSGTADSAYGRAVRPTTPNPSRRSEPHTTRAPTKPIKGIWRPDVEASGPPDTPPRRHSSPSLPSLPHDPNRKGGISFDDDDLADYMHPDDVPPKLPAKDPDDGEGEA